MADIVLLKQSELNTISSFTHKETALLRNIINYAHSHEIKTSYIYQSTRKIKQTKQKIYKGCLLISHDQPCHAVDCNAFKTIMNEYLLKQ